MKFLILLMMISSSSGSFNGCPMDGCDGALSGFVDININGFDKDVQWRRNDLLNNNISRGCVSNGMFSLICAVDIGYVSLNVTNGELLWSIDIETQEIPVTASLPVINYQGYSIIANNTQCALIDPKGLIAGTFNYNPILLPPLAGPFVTDAGQIIVADSNSFVAILDSGIPLGVQPFPPGFRRVSRSVSLNPDANRWYIIAQYNTTLSKAIIAAETTGSIVARLRIAWVYEYDIQSNLCNGKEGPLVAAGKWLVVVNTTGIVVVADNGDSANTEYLIKRPGLCADNMVFSESDSILLMVDKRTYDIIVLNISTQNVSSISLSNISQEEIIGQLSRITIIQNHRMIILVVTSSRKAILLLIDYNNHQLVASFNLGNVRETITFEPLTQLTYTETDDQRHFVTVAHQAVGVVTVRLVTNDSFSF